MSGAAGALSGVAGATPYGALASVAGQAMSAALAPVPTNVTAGAGSYAAGPFVIGARTVGKGNDAGATSASQTANQQPSDAMLAAAGLPPWFPLAAMAGAAVLVLVFVLQKKA